MSGAGGRTRAPRSRRNPLIDAGVENVDDKDTALLRRFISDRGKIRSPLVTGLTVKTNPRFKARQG